MKAARKGVDVVPVWNKSYRGLVLWRLEPLSARKAAGQAVADLGWKRNYFVDADHINIDNVGGFLDACDFYTIDVASAISGPVGLAEIAAFLRAIPR